MRDIQFLKKLKLIIKRIYNKIRLLINKNGNRKKCYICGQTFGSFTKYRGGFKNIPLWHKKLNCVGSDIDNFGCIYCKSSDRERHLFMYFDKINFWSEVKDREIIHFAPEKNLSKKIEQLSPLKYVKADLFPKDRDIHEIDLIDIPYKDESFDILICNHVLEHIPEYFTALREIFRVLKKGGTAILQTPYSKLLQNNFEDPGINNDELRLLYYGQEDHVRYFSEDQFFKSLVKAGFKLQIVKHIDIFENNLAKYYGVNKNEDLIRVSKPSS